MKLSLFEMRQAAGEAGLGKENENFNFGCIQLEVLIKYPPGEVEQALGHKCIRSSSKI